MSDATRRNRRAAVATPNGPPAPAIDRPRIEAAVREILLAVGEDPDREGLVPRS
jgi:GTP cyclohydrolase IA